MNDLGTASRAAWLVLLLALAGCAGGGAENPPSMTMARADPAAMQAKADSFCEPFGMEAAMVGWRFRSFYGKRGTYLMQTIWECRPPPAE
jgi:hypothetical protein